MTVRDKVRWVHCYTGLAIALFLLITATTGILLPFSAQIDDWINQDIAYITPQQRPLQSIAQLHDQVQTTFPKQSFSSMPVTILPNRALVFEVDRQRKAKSDRERITKSADTTKSSKPLQSNTIQQVYVNPYTGAIVATRNLDTWSWRNTMNKVFWLHRSLLLGEFGKWMLGIVGLIWTLNCFIGFYLTLPITKKTRSTNCQAVSAKGQSHHAVIVWLKRWRPAWRVRRHTNMYKLNYDLHHALGLWLWVMSFVIAWSSVAYNLKSVYQPVMMAIGLQTPKLPPSPSKPQASTLNITSNNRLTTDNLSNNGLMNNNSLSPLAIDKYHAIATLTATARQVSQEQGFHFEKPLGLRFIADEKQWQLRFKTQEDVGIGRGASSITMDAVTGQVVRTHFGSQVGRVNQFEQWILSLHQAYFDNVWYRLFLSCFGLSVIIMTLTGIYLWLKRRARLQKQARHQLRVLQGTSNIIS